MCIVSQNSLCWRRPLGPPGPTPLLKLSHPEQAVQDHLQASFEDIQEGRLQNLSGQPVPALHHLYNEEVLPDV